MTNSVSEINLSDIYNNFAGYICWFLASANSINSSDAMQPELR
ncbi:MAG: hypothetical protein ABJP66_06800 [Hyphomicrobiales bacterium]